MNNIEKIYDQIEHYATLCGRQPNEIKLLAVTKNQLTSKIIPLLDKGHRLFGENRIQEAHSKWPTLRTQYSDIKLHLIGHLQTNKVKEAVALFDTIETLDSFKLANKLIQEQERQGRHLTYYIEINIGEEPQKSGVSPVDIDRFISTIRRSYPLNVEGIMCIPPQDKDPTVYFQKMKSIANEHNLSVISMGMSNDYQIAIQCGATLIRLGRSLFE